MIVAVTIVAVTMVAGAAMSVVGCSALGATQAEGGSVDTTGPGGDTTTATTPGADSSDPVLLALQDLVHTATQVSEAIQRLNSRATYIRAGRQRGAPYRDIVTEEDRPLIAELLTETIQRFEAAGTRFRQAEARALHQEGVTMEQIAELFGVTRQRISALLRAAAPPAAGRPRPAEDPSHT